MMAKANSNSIYTELKDQIIKGQYAPNFALTEIQLANKYGVCRNTVKKSLMMLETDGLVTLERNKGARVKVCSISEILEMQDVRCILESYITVNAAHNISKKDLSKLENILNEMTEHKMKNEIIEYSVCNRQFHSIIFEACTNRTAVDLTNHLKNQMKKYNGKTILVPGRAEQSLKEHIAIFEALKIGDAEAAGEAMKTHMKNVAETFKTYFQLLI